MIYKFLIAGYYENIVFWEVKSHEIFVIYKYLELKHFPHLQSRTYFSYNKH
jgi:hypothetical protein